MNRKTTDRKKCSKCLKYFTKRTLKKYNGICGRCNKTKNGVNKKNKIPKSLRTKVWKDNIGNSLTGECYCCKRTIYNDDFHCAHIISNRDGGTITVGNLKPTCRPCNLSSGTINLDSFADAMSENKTIQSNDSIGFRRIPEHMKINNKTIQSNDSIGFRRIPEHMKINNKTIQSNNSIGFRRIPEHMKINNKIIQSNNSIGFRRIPEHMKINNKTIQSNNSIRSRIRGHMKIKMHRLSNKINQCKEPIRSRILDHMKIKMCTICSSPISPLEIGNTYGNIIVSKDGEYTHNYCLGERSYIKDLMRNPSVW
jgi:hypothetical protein